MRSDFGWSGRAVPLAGAHGGSEREEVLCYRPSKEDQAKEHWGGEWSTAEEVRDD